MEGLGVMVRIYIYIFFHFRPNVAVLAAAQLSEFMYKSAVVANVAAQIMVLHMLY